MPRDGRRRVDSRAWLPVSLLQPMTHRARDVLVTRYAHCNLRTDSFHLSIEYGDGNVNRASRYRNDDLSHSAGLEGRCRPLAVLTPARHLPVVDAEQRFFRDLDPRSPQ